MTIDYSAQTCLFSAPYSFIPDLPETFNAVVSTKFIEIWRKEQVPNSAEYTVWIMNPGQNFIIDAEVLNRLPNIQLLVTPSTGRNHIDLDECKRRSITVYSLLDDRPGLNKISASAEFSFLLLLNSLRRLDFAVEEVRDGRWRHREDMLRGQELSGRKVGLVGLGRIGSRLARYCEAFDAFPHYYDPYVDNSAVPRYTDLGELFTDCSAVCICCTLTDETTGMIQRELIERLPAGASLVNTARGEVINEQDLLHVLQQRPDLSVGLDVLAHEVTGTHLDSPLVDLHRAGRIVITPHIAGASADSQGKAAAIALKLMQRHFDHA